MKEEEDGKGGKGEGGERGGGKNTRHSNSELSPRVGETILVFHGAGLRLSLRLSVHAKV